MYDYDISLQTGQHVLMKIPLFEESNFSFKRVENNGYISVRSKNVPKLHELFLNSTSQQIINQCNGKNTVEQIIRNLSDVYPNIQRQVLGNDILKNLTILSRYQLITWLGRNPFMKKLCENISGLEFTLLDEGDIRDILEFINIKEDASKLQYLNLMSGVEIYTDELYLREVLFSFSEDFFAIKDKDEIKGIISLKYHPNLKSTVCNVGIICCEEGYVKNLLEGVTQYSYHTCTREVYKIKIALIAESESGNNTLAPYLEEFGFTNEGRLKKEIDGNDILNYSYYYKTEEEAVIC